MPIISKASPSRDPPTYPLPPTALSEAASPHGEVRPQPIPGPKAAGPSPQETCWLWARVWPGVTGRLCLQEERECLIPRICRESRDRANHSSPGRDSRTVVFRWNFSMSSVMCTDPRPSFLNQAAGQGQQHMFNPLGGNDFKEVICTLPAGTANRDLKPDCWASKRFAPWGGSGGQRRCELGIFTHEVLYQGCHVLVRMLCTAHGRGCKW